MFSFPDDVLKRTYIQQTDSIILFSFLKNLICHLDLQNRLQTMAMTYMQGTPDTMLQEELHKLQVSSPFFNRCCKNAKSQII